MIDAFFFRTLGPWIRRYWWVWFPLSVAFFVAFPGVDLMVSGWFWDPEKGWFWSKTPWAEFVRKKLPYFLIGSVLGAIVVWGAFRLCGRAIAFVTGKACTYLVLSLSIGPGLLANSLFKENWGRARPSQITQFGGTKTFTPPFEITDQCVSNCSFVSGHGALGLWVTAWALCVLRRGGGSFAHDPYFREWCGLCSYCSGGSFFFRRFLPVSSFWLSMRHLPRGCWILLNTAGTWVRHAQTPRVCLLSFRRNSGALYFYIRLRASIVRVTDDKA